MFLSKIASPKHGHTSSFGGDVFSLHSSKVVTLRTSNFEEKVMKTGKNKKTGGKNKKTGGKNVSGDLMFHNSGGYGLGGGTGSYPPPNPTFAGGSTSGGARRKESGNGKDLHMFVWSSSNSPVSESGQMKSNGNVNRSGSTDLRLVNASKSSLQQEIANSKENACFDQKKGQPTDIGEAVSAKFRPPNGSSPFTAGKKVDDMEEGGDETRNHQMPPASVMTRLILIMVWRKLIRNPNTYSSLFGLAWSLISFKFGIKMPSIVHGSISILSDAGLGMAMFSSGLFMALQPKIIACGNSVATFSMAVRFLTGPAVIAATSIAVGLRGTVLHVAIVQAALPQGIVPFVFAKEYNVHANILSTAVIFGMLIALPITILYYILLGV